LANYLYFGICGFILSLCPFSPQSARRRRRRRKKKEENEEEVRCSLN